MRQSQVDLGGLRTVIFGPNQRRTDLLGIDPYFDQPTYAGSALPAFSCVGADANPSDGATEHNPGG